MDYQKQYKEKLKERINAVLNAENSPIKELSNKSIEEILEEVSIYHQELEFQNLELMRIRDELEKSKSHFAELFQNAPIGYVVFDSNHYIKSVNNMFAKILGTEPKPLINQSITYFVHPNSQDNLYFLTKNILKDKKPATIDLTLRNLSNDISVKASFNVFDDDGEIHIRMAVMDNIITKQNEIEEEATDNLINEIEKLSKKTFLIAEDDEVSSFYLSQVLEFHYNKLLFARTGAEAVDLCKSNPDISLILMDIKMPEMDGLTATRKIREFNKDVVIIAQTAFALTGDKEKALNAGCNDYLTKPIKANKLLEIINKYL